jgi:hypothetical protein
MVLVEILNLKNFWMERSALSCLTILVQLLLVISSLATVMEGFTLKVLGGIAMGIIGTRMDRVTVRRAF